MSFPRYPKYKDSGVEWLGELPEHWEVKPLKHLAGIDSCGSYGVEPEDGETVLPVATTAQIGPDGRFDVGRMPLRGFSPSDVQRYGCSTGDILVVKSSGSATNIISGKTGLVDESTPSFVFSNFLMRVRPVPERALPKFIYALLRSHLTRQRVELMCSTTTYPNLQIGDYTSAPLPVPPVAEQASIAEFLDRETGKIDKLVAEQRRLMELLNEEIISLVLSSFHAPETCELRLNEASTIISRPVTQKADKSYTRIGLFNRGRGLFHKDASEMDDMGESDFFWVEEGDLIISGQFAWEGAVALADKEDTGCVVSHRYPVIRGKTGIALTEYLLGLLSTKHGDFLLNENSRGAAGRNRPLNISSLMKEKIPVPNMRVQEAVARAVHARKVLFKEIAKAIDLLQERRTALISAAVTGQIDVRHSAPTPAKSAAAC